MINDRKDILVTLCKFKTFLSKQQTQLLKKKKKLYYIASKISVIYISSREKRSKGVGIKLVAKQSVLRREFRVEQRAMGDCQVV